MYKIIHNPRCRKSREALKFLQEKKNKNSDFRIFKRTIDKEST